MNRPDPRFVGSLTFHCDDSGELLGTERCSGRRDAKEHAAHLATQYGTVAIKRDGKTLATVDETYLDALMGAF